MKKRLNPVLELAETKKMLAALMVENQQLPVICCTRWFKLTVWALTRLGYGQKRVDDFTAMFFDCVEQANNNDTWEDEVTAMLGHRINMPEFDFQSVIDAGKETE